MSKSSARSNIPPSASPSTGTESMTSGIGTLNEGHVHAALKQRYVQPGDLTEADVDGYIVDILRGEQIIEIQTANFAAIAKKMRDLSQRHPVRLVHPIAADRWIVKLPQDGAGAETRRKSPKHGGFEDIFHELVSFPELCANPNFELEVVLTLEEEVRHRDGQRRWRRNGWVTVERRLLDVVATTRIRGPEDLAALLPDGLPDTFHTGHLAAALDRPRALAQRIAYCLRRCDVIRQFDKDGNTVIYARVTA